MALAQFLGIETIAYQDERIKGEDGVLRFLHLNPTRFRDRGNLVNRVMEDVAQRWKPDWKNRLVLGRASTEHKDVILQKERPARYYHIEVENQHLERLAQDCLVFLEKVVDSDRHDITPEKLVEFKWEGVTTSRVTIPPKKSRSFDAFYILQDQQNHAYLGVNPFIVDYSEFQYKLSLPGRYALTYVVFSNGLGPARETFFLDSNGTVAGTKFYKQGEEPPATEVASRQVPDVAVGAVGTSGSALVSQPGTLTPYWSNLRPEDQA